VIVSFLATVFPPDRGPRPALSAMIRDRDALELLLPDADDDAVRHARDVTRFLRLLSTDAEPARACVVGVDIERARAELERADRADLEWALCDLLRHHLSAAASEDSFAWFGEPVLDVRGAWRILGDFELDHEWIASVPAPEEDTRAICERFLDSLERLGVPPARLALWRARVAHALVGPQAAEPLYREELKRASGRLVPSSHARAALAGIAECRLERGAVRDARALLVDALPQHGSDPRLRQLLSWSRLALGDAAGARAATAGLKPWSGPIPAGLAALRDARPDWLPCLAGRSSGTRASRDVDLVRDRHELGAALLTVFSFRPGVGARPLHVDAAVGLRARALEWARRREDAHWSAGSPEHTLVKDARLVVEHAPTDGTLRHVAGGATTRASAWSPVLDDDGEVAGWLYVECEHHLLPGPRRLEALARAWRSRVIVAREREDAVIVPAEPARSARALDLVEEGPGASVFRALVDSLGFKLHQRCYFGFVPHADGPRLVARGGEGVGFERERPGLGRALARAVATGGVVTFDEPDERLSIHAGAASGFVVPLCVVDRACGFLVVESSRRRDFRPKDVEAGRRAAEEFGLVLRTAQMVAWHRERFRFEPWFDPRREDFRAFATNLVTAARSRTPVVLCGPSGVGKLVLARWIHFESGRSSAPFKVHTCGLEGDGASNVHAWLASAEGGTLLLDDVDRLAPARQEELLRVLEHVERAVRPDAQDEPSTRILATTSVGLSTARESGRLRPDLASRLDRWTLLVPRLRDRREEIPGLFAAMSERFAREEDREPPRLTDEAVALLWRQRWDENLRGLENLAYKLVLLRGGTGAGAADAVTPDDLVRLGRRFGLEFVQRLPSRHPERRDVVAALRTTRAANGRLNKTRASIYLGWDPDTLVARMESEGIDEALLRGSEAWRAHAGVEGAVEVGRSEDADDDGCHDRDDGHDRDDAPREAQVASDVRDRDEERTGVAARGGDESGDDESRGDESRGDESRGRETGTGETGTAEKRKGHRQSSMPAAL